MNLWQVGVSTLWRRGNTWVRTMLALLCSTFSVTRKSTFLMVNLPYCYVFQLHVIHIQWYVLYSIINEDKSVWLFEDHSCMFSFMYLYHIVCSRDLHLFSDNHQIKISHKSFLSLSLQWVIKYNSGLWSKLPQPHTLPTWLCSYTSLPLAQLEYQQYIEGKK